MLVPKGYVTVKEVSLRARRSVSTVYTWQREVRNGYPKLRFVLRAGVLCVEEGRLKRFLAKWPALGAKGSAK